MTPKGTFIFTLLVGLSLFVYSFRLDFYSNQKAKDKLDHEMTGKLPGDNYENAKRHYYEELDKLETKKIAFLDLGAGLTIASLTIIFFLHLQKIQTFSDFKNVISISKQTIYVLANILWLLLIPGTFWYYSYRGVRGDYPWFADSIGISLMETIPVIFLGLIPLNLFIVLTTLKSNFPAKIFIKRTEYKTTGILWEIFWGFWLFVNLLCLIGFIMDGDHISIPINLFFTYLLLTLRAGQIDGKT